VGAGRASSHSMGIHTSLILPFSFFLKRNGGGGVVGSGRLPPTSWLPHDRRVDFVLCKPKQKDQNSRGDSRRKQIPPRPRQNIRTL
jgi:hypothetical protein